MASEPSIERLIQVASAARGGPSEPEVCPCRERPGAGQSGALMWSLCAATGRRGGGEVAIPNGGFRVWSCRSVGALIVHIMMQRSNVFGQ